MQDQVSRDKRSWLYAKPRSGFSLDKPSRAFINNLSLYKVEFKDAVLEAIGDIHDWDTVLKCAKDQLVLPMIGYHLNTWLKDDKIPEAVTDFAIKAYYDTLSRNMLKTEIVMPCLIKLSKDMPVMLLKGLLFNEVLYSNPGLRPMTDFDVLIEMKNRDKADKLLKDMGLTRPQEARYGKWEERSHHFLYSVKSPDGPIPIEVHTRLFTAEIMKPDYEKIWRECSDIEVYNSRFFSPDKNHLCLYTLLTPAMQSFQIELRRLADIYAVIEGNDPDIGKVIELAKDWRGFHFLKAVSLFMKEYLVLTPRLVVFFTIMQEASLPFLDKFMFNHYFNTRDYIFNRYEFSFHRQRLNAYLITEDKVGYLSMLLKSLWNAMRFGYPS